jgi:hypothetical protein
MDVDDIPQQLEELFDRSRAALDAQVTKARKAVDSLNVEKTSAAKALAELKDQYSQAKASSTLFALIWVEHRAPSRWTARSKRRARSRSGSRLKTLRPPPPWRLG